MVGILIEKERNISNHNKSVLLKSRDTVDNKEKLVVPTSEYIINVAANSITEPAIV